MKRQITGCSDKNMTLTALNLRLAMPEGKINEILRSDWLPGRAR